MEYAMLQNIIALLFSLGGGLRLREGRYKTSITVNNPEIRSSSVCEIENSASLGLRVWDQEFGRYYYV